MIRDRKPGQWRVAGTLVLALLVAQLAPLPAAAAGSQRANFGDEPATAEARHVANWVVAAGDSRGLPFVIVDKVDARVFVFDSLGRLRGASAALVGLAQGDESVPGIGKRKMSTIRPNERTTPAGRFEASMERSLHGDKILWVDYEAAVALHRVAAGVPVERRLQRLNGTVPLDRRITYGCINVPVKFFDDVVIPAFARSIGIVYVLPESRPSRDVFGSYDVDEQDALRNDAARAGSSVH